MLLESISIPIPLLIAFALIIVLAIIGGLAANSVRRNSPRHAYDTEIGMREREHNSAQAEERKLYRLIASGECPDCHGYGGFYDGPEGGMSRNIFCVNRECRAGFNITPMIATAERIGKGDLARYPKPPGLPSKKRSKR